MVRTFETHHVRSVQELSGSLWDFSPLGGDFAGRHYVVPVPSCWETYPDFSSYRGEGVYTTRFTAEGMVRLVFKGVSHTAVVLVDGCEVGRHYNAYNIFSIVVNGLVPGQHILEVQVDNRFSEASALHIPNDYMTYGGIIRPVVLEHLHGPYLKQVHFIPSGAVDAWSGVIEATVANPDCAVHTVCAQSTLAGQTLALGTVTLGAGEEAILRCEGSFIANAWMPESPVLYLLDTTLTENGAPVDDLIERVGFRTVEVHGDAILLNGRRVRIKGFCRHEDHPQFGCALCYTAIAQDLNLMRDLGANSVRTSHYPNDELFLDLCDEMGFLVWEENHARGLSEEQMRNENFQRQCADCIAEMIPAHYNHPCIYLWGILNECASETQYGYTCYKTQFAQIHTLDESRPRSFASCKFKSDLCLGLPEIVSYNIYPKWYHDAPVAEYLDDLYQWVQRETDGAGKPFIISEIGAGAIYGNRTSSRDKWSEEYQSDALCEQVSAVLTHPGCTGLYIWQFCDVRVSREWFYCRPRTMNNKGIVDEYRRRKLAYDVVKKLYHSVGNYF
ncbi:MAG: hypothetical protein MR004_03090 [Clostridiales bacterium]|nr:hypothetical protein [Clostridiales bacterium]